MTDIVANRRATITPGIGVCSWCLSTAMVRLPRWLSVRLFIAMHYALRPVGLEARCTKRCGIDENGGIYEMDRCYFICRAGRASTAVLL